MRKNKLNNHKTVIDGIAFGSDVEASYYLVLKRMEESGDISDLKCQVKYPLIPAHKRSDGYLERPIDYIADFTFMRDGELVVQDVKGYRKTNEAPYRIFVMKRKLMLCIHGISVEEITAKGKGDKMSFSKVELGKRSTKKRKG